MGDTMKKFFGILTILCVVLSVLLTVHTSASAQLISKDEIIKSYKKLGDYTVAVAEKMPADSYSFRPNDQIMTFAEQMNHIAGANYYMGSILKKSMQKEFKSTDKETIIKDLKGSIEFVISALEDMEMKDFEETMEFFTGPRTRFHAYLFMVDHMTHHRGYSMTYLRVMGIKPPDFTSW